MTLTALAERYRIGKSTCRVALVRPSPTGDAAISDFLGVPASELWPDRYDTRGNRLITLSERLKSRTRKRHD
jgi:Ner family transcriptional regulator